MLAARGSVRHWLHKLHVTISWPHALTLQSSLAVTQYKLIAPHFTYDGAMEAIIKLVCSRDWTRTSYTRERTCIRVANALTNWAMQIFNSYLRWNSGHSKFLQCHTDHLKSLYVYVPTTLWILQRRFRCGFNSASNCPSVTKCCSFHQPQKDGSMSQACLL